MSVLQRTRRRKHIRWLRKLVGKTVYCLFAEEAGRVAEVLVRFHVMSISLKDNNEFYLDVMHVVTEQPTYVVTGYMYSQHSEVHWYLLSRIMTRQNTWCAQQLPRRLKLRAEYL